MNTVPRGLLGNPSNVYLGIVESLENAKTSCKSLANLGLDKESILIYSDAKDKEAFVNADINVTESNDFNRGIRQLFAADEVSREAHYRDAINDGRYVIQVEIAASEKETRSDIENILTNHSVQDITYFSPHRFETIASN